MYGLPETPPIRFQLRSQQPIMAVNQSEAQQFSIPLPRSLDTRIHLRLSTRAKAIVLSLATASQDDAASVAAMGSFVYALPNVRIKPSDLCSRY